MSATPPSDSSSPRGSRSRFFSTLTGAWKVLVVVAAALVLLALASKLDPNHSEQVARDQEGENARKAHEAKLAALEKANEKAPAKKKGEERLGINFTDLSFVPAREAVDAKTGQPKYDDQAPDNIKALNGRTVRIRGYMLPVRMEGNEVREFMIMPNQLSCCYGGTPRFWEFVVSEKKGDAVPNLMDTLLTFEGVLKVGDVFENGYWTQFYTLECTNVIK